MADQPGEIAAPEPASTPEDGVQLQSAGFLLELSPDWLVLSASENVHRFLGEYHARLIGEHLSNYTLAQPLHDLRNTLTRQRSVEGVARAYRVRLVDEPRHFDFAFQHVDSRILLEGVPSPEQGFGEWMGSVSRLIDGLGNSSGRQRLEGATRRMRALGGFDRVVLDMSGGETVESSRGNIEPDEGGVDDDLPAILADASGDCVPMFPRDRGQRAASQALLKAPTAKQLERLRQRHVESFIRLPMHSGDDKIGEFRCECRSPRPAVLELHAAGELFAQVLAMVVTGQAG